MVTNEQDSNSSNISRQLMDPVEIRQVSLSRLKPMLDQPRQSFNDSTIDELAQSIQSHGILQPLLVVQISEGHFQIIAGERRFRAAKKAGLTTVPVIVREENSHTQMEIALVENIQREELNPIDEAMALQKLITSHSHTHESLSVCIGRERSTITNSLRLLSLPPEIQMDVRDRKLTPGHGRALCSLNNKKLQLKFGEIIQQKKLSVRQTEELIKSQKKLKTEVILKADAVPSELRYLCEDLKSQLQMKVRITGNSDRGKIEIEYFSMDDLEKLRGLLMGKDTF